MNDKILEKIYWFFRILLSPNSWLQNYPYSPIWDAEFERCLGKYTWNLIDSYCAKLGPHTIWITNHPYASMRPMTDKVVATIGSRPSLKNILLGYDKLLKDIDATSPTNKEINDYLSKTNG